MQGICEMGFLFPENGLLMLIFGIAPQEGIW